MKIIFVLPPAVLLAGCIVIPQPESRRVWGPAPAPPPPVQMQPTQPPPPPPVVMEAPPSLDDTQIVIVYQQTLDRRPSEREVWEWRERSHQQQISPEEVRHALHDSSEFRQQVPDRVIRRAFKDYHGVEPNAEELRLYRRRMIDEDWSIDRVRQDISRRTVNDVAASREDERNRRGNGRDRGREDGNDGRGRREEPGRRGSKHDGRSFDAIVTRAYSDVLERKPDAAGRANYIRRLEQGASEADVRAALRQSEEFRVLLPDAKTRRAYQEVLGREPDEGGLQHYRKLIVDKGWTENDVKNDLRKSAEYRNRKR